MSSLSIIILLINIILISSSDIKVGITHTKTKLVTENVTAAALGNEGIKVFATPFLVALVEQTSRECITPYMKEGERTVGIRVNLKHLSATPIGMSVTCKSKLVEIDGRKFSFNVECYDDIELIGTATHERFLINQNKFVNKANSKLHQ